MNFSELLILMVIALILFGPEDLPDIARAVGRIVYEVKKIAGEMTQEFQNVVEAPSNVLKKTLDETVNRTVPNNVTKEDTVVSSDSIVESTESADSPSAKVEEEEVLLTYEEEDPLADLPKEVVSYEKKG